MMTDEEYVFDKLYEAIEPEIGHYINDVIKYLKEDFNIKEKVATDLLTTYLGNNYDFTYNNLYDKSKTKRNKK